MSGEHKDGTEEHRDVAADGRESVAPEDSSESSSECSTAREDTSQKEVPLADVDNTDDKNVNKESTRQEKASTCKE